MAQRRVVHSFLGTALVLAGLGPAARAQEPQAGLSAVPLATRAPAAAGATRFQRLDAERTGVDFRHAWTPPPKYEHVLGNGLAGGGVAVGDVDGDGRPDLVLTRPFGGARLYRNLGDFRFEDATERAGLLADEHWSTGASLVDVDGDGDLDLHVCGYDTPNRLWINAGDGTFSEGAAAAGLAFTGASIAMAFADYDGDGDLDGYLLTNRHDSGPLPKGDVPTRDGRPYVPPELAELYTVVTRPDGVDLVVRAGQFDRLFENDGGGRFTDVTAGSGIVGNDFGLSATWFDYDEDGRPDLYVANDFHGPDRLYRNEGGGRFRDVAPAALPHTPWFSMGSDYADVDGDGLLDLLATDMSGRGHYRQKLAMGDMNENGWFLESGTPRQYMRNALYLNTGTGRFREAAFLAGIDSSNWTWSPRFGDLDEDGREDLFISNGMTRDYFNSDLRDQLRAQGLAGDALQQNSFWNDAPELAEPNLAFRNLGDLRFQNVGDAWGLGEVGVSFGATLSDLDGDGDLDVVVNDFDRPAALYRNGSSEGRRVTVALRGRASNTSGWGATLRLTSARGTQVRQLGSSRGYMAAADAVAHFGLGADAAVERLVVEWPSGHVQTFTSLPADRHFVVQEPEGEAPPRAPRARPTPIFTGSLGSRSVEAPYDDYAREPLLPYQLSRLGPALAVGDVNGDGTDDYVLGGPAGSPAQLFLNEGHRRFVPVEGALAAAGTAAEDAGLLLFDADGDGDRDLYLVSGGTECAPGDEVLADRLLFNDGAGGFGAAPADALPDLRDSGGPVAAADFDRDGDLDLFVGGRSVPGAYPARPQSRLLRNDGGRFVDASDELAPGLRDAGLVVGALWSDADGDGWVDLLLAREWGPIGLWRNEGGRLADATEAAGLGAHSGWWNGLAGADLDGDGHLDYVAANNGLNSKYVASAEHPALIYYGDYDGSGRRQIIEAQYEDEHLYPVRGRSCSSAAMPFLRERFTDFDTFASALLVEIYPTDRLEQAERSEAKTLASSVLINEGAPGAPRFRVVALPRELQIAPGQGVLLTEIDGDGRPDLVLAQNSYAPQRETGRMDGGVSALGLGTGDGGFRLLRADASGIVVPADAKSLVATDFDGDGRADLLVGVNDGELRAFHNGGAGSGRGLAVRLAGAPGNADAVGARVTLHVPGLPAQTGEIAAGNGYLSQSAPAVFFGLGAHVGEFSAEVRWPDGEVTRHAGLSAAGGRLVLARD